MRILFFTLIPIKNLKEKGIYNDMISEFNDQGDNVDYYFPNKEKYFNVEQNVSFISIKTRDNPQKQSNFIKKYFLYLEIEHNLTKLIKHNNKNYDLLIIVTPSIFQLKIINIFKNKNPKAKVLLLLKDIFPDNAIDLGILKNYFPMNIAIKHFKSIEKKLYDYVDHIGCMTPLNIEYIANKHHKIKEKLFLSPNSIKPYKIPRIENRKSLGLPVNKKILIYTGNIGLPQDPELIKQFIQLLPNNYYMILIGSGTNFPIIEKENLLIINKVLKQYEVDQYLINSDYGLVFLSEKFNVPNFPSKILNYLNANLPLISITNKYNDLRLGFLDTLLFNKSKSSYPFEIINEFNHKINRIGYKNNIFRFNVSNQINTIKGLISK